MSTEKEFSETILSTKKVLEHLEFDSSILYYEMGYLRTEDNVAKVRMFKYRILPAINRVCDHIDELRLIKLRANRLMADLLGQGRG